MTRPLRIVAKADMPSEPPNLDYEWQQRQRIMCRNWGAVHAAADKRAPFATVLGRLR